MLLGQARYDGMMAIDAGGLNISIIVHHEHNHSRSLQCLTLPFSKNIQKCFTMKNNQMGFPLNN